MILAPGSARASVTSSSRCVPPSLVLLHPSPALFSPARCWISRLTLLPPSCAQDESCVDELLALPPGKNLKISKRKVRLERCKTTAAAARAKASARTVASLPGRAGAAAAAASGGSKKGTATDGRPKAVRLAAPRDPTLSKHGRSGPSAPRSKHQEQLAEALAQLPGDERKKIKSMDAERIARRAAKKESKRLSERYERKQANVAKKSGGGVAGEILGREPRALERARKEKKRIATQSKSSLKKKGPRT